MAEVVDVGGGVVEWQSFCITIAAHEYKKCQDKVE